MKSHRTIFWIEVTHQYTGRPLSVDVDKIEGVGEGTTGCCIYTGADAFLVKESRQEVLQMVADAKPLKTLEQMLDEQFRPMAEAERIVERKRRGIPTTRGY
jgi:hypothetical protein